MGFTESSRAVRRSGDRETGGTGSDGAPGVPLLTVEDPGRFRLEATVDESKMGAVKLGETVPVVIDALGEQRHRRQGDADCARGRSREPDASR